MQKLHNKHEISSPMAHMKMPYLSKDQTLFTTVCERIGKRHDGRIRGGLGVQSFLTSSKSCAADAPWEKSPKNDRMRSCMTGDGTSPNEYKKSTGGRTK